VLLAIAAAQSALPALAPMPEAQEVAARGLAVAQDWATGAPLAAREVYEPIPWLLEQQHDADGATKAALFSVLAALYHATWTAARLAPRTRAAPPLPSDVAEIGDDYVARAAAYAISAAADPAAERLQLIAVADKLSKHGVG
jgi:hypothetical protein